MHESISQEYLNNPLLRSISQWAEKSDSAVCVINSSGIVLLASQLCNECFEISSGNKILIQDPVDGGNILFNSAKTASEESLLSPLSVFNFDFEGQKAYLLILSIGSSDFSNQLPEKNSFLDSLLGIMPGVAYQCANDEKWTMSYLSEGCYSLTGYSSEELIGNKTISFAELIHPEDRNRIWQEIQTALRENRPYQLLYRIRHAAGDFRSVQEQGKAVYYKNGDLSGLEGWIIDITERNRTEQALVDSESRYRTLVEASPDAVILAGINGDIVFCNRQLGQLLGVQDINSLIGKNALQFVTSNSAQNSETDLIRSLSGDDSHRGVYQVQTIDGRVLPVEVSIRGITDSKGNPTAYMGVVRDISVSEKNLHALKTSEARYRAIVEDNPEMIVRFTPTGVVTFANQAYCAYYNMTPKELIGHKLTEVLPPPSRRTVQRILDYVTNEMSPAVHEHSIKGKNGNTVWYRWKTRAIHDEEGDFIEYQSVGENITEQKRSEQAIEESEELLRNVMESIKLIAIILDMQGNLVFCNSHFLEVVGWQKIDAIGKNWFDHFVPMDVTISLKKRLLDGVLGGDFPRRNENTILAKKGEQRLIAWNNTLLQDTHGNTTGIASIGEDITEKYYSEKTQEVIYKISQAALGSNDLPDLFKSIHTVLLDLMPVENFFIALYDQETDLLTFPYHVDQFDPQFPPQKLGHGLTEYVIRSGKTLLANPEVFNLLLEENEVEAIGAPSVDWMGVPLKIENRVIGAMVSQTYSEGVRFKKRDEQIFTFVSSQVAMAIERKRVDQELRTSKKRNEVLVDASKDGILLETLDGQILDCNLVLENMYGYSRDELLKIKVADLIEKSYLSDKPDYVAWELAQGGFITDVPNVRKDGSIFQVEVSTRLTNVEGDQLVVAYVRDISERKKVERAIVESEAKFRALAQTAAAGIFIHRGDNYLYVNPMWSEITGYPEEELLKISFWEAIVPDELSSVKQRYMNRIRDGADVIRYETTIFTRGGEKKYLDITAGMIDYEGEKATIGTAIDITHRKQREHELEVVAHISEDLRLSLTRDEINPAILKQLLNLLEVDGAIISTIEKAKELYIYTRANGCFLALDRITLKASEGLSGYIIVSGKSYINNHASHDPYFAFPELAQKLTSLAGVPLISKGETIGALVVGSASVLSEKDLRLLRTIGDLAASALHRSDLYEQTSQQAQELKQAYDATLEGWAHALELRDKETQGHSLRIANLTLKLAKRMGYLDSDLENVRRGALLHDIGKMGVPDTILLKPGSLNEEEWEIMQKHPVYAVEMLSELPYFREALDIPYSHHEWWDGSGYPRGLKGTEIPLVARIFSIVDAWDALISDRPYRKAWTRREALSHIIDQTNTHFDPEVVNAFVAMFKEEKI